MPGYLAILTKLRYTQVNSSENFSCKSEAECGLLSLAY